MKTLEVYPELTLAHLEEHFTKLFPCLQLKLLTSDLIHGNEKEIALRTMDELAGTTTHCCFLIEADMSVADLENNFRECYGLPIQVNRWTGFAWHDTDDTHDWTLDQQNDKGSEGKAHSTKKPPETNLGGFLVAAGTFS